MSATWRADIWSCFEPIEDCLFGYFAPCILYGRTNERLTKNTNNEADHDLVNTDCLIFAASLYCGCAGILTFLKRTEIRQRYNIPGTTVEDLFFGCCCACCALVQQDKEVRERLATGVNTDGYQAPQPMSQ